MSVKLQKKLAGRVEMCLNTARHHPDKQVQDDNQVRAQAYMNAMDDAKNDDECNALVELWKAVDQAVKDKLLVGTDYLPIHAALDKLEEVWTGKKKT